LLSRMSFDENGASRCGVHDPRKSSRWRWRCTRGFASLHPGLKASAAPRRKARRRGGQGMMHQTCWLRQHAPRPRREARLVVGVGERVERVERFECDEFTTPVQSHRRATRRADNELRAARLDGARSKEVEQSWMAGYGRCGYAATSRYSTQPLRG
jgi:hypothetical protein